MTSVGVIGARRQRQGLGAFVVRDLLAAGADVPCFLATSEETRDAARDELLTRWGIEPRGYLDVGRMLAAEKLDALVICSPAATHESYLEAALATGLPALCEKPLVWGRADLAATARRLVSGFVSRRLVLWEVCQWPYTLSAFEALHPGSLVAPPRHFAMRLQPGSRGAQMLGDALPHPLSLLQALCPDAAPSLDGLRFASSDDERRLDLDFTYRSAFGDVWVEIRLEQASGYPREAELVIDGRRARRLVADRGYRLSFADGDRSVAVSDPLGLLVADFVRELRERGGAAAASRTREIVVRMQLLEAIVAAHATATGASS